MEKTYTQKDLLLYIYNELPNNELTEIAKAIEANNELKFQYLALVEMYNLLNTGYAEPSNSSIEIIMRHSAKGRKEELV